jgi:tetratricopeptide (TPR) repeat protein
MIAKKSITLIIIFLSLLKSVLSEANSQRDSLLLLLQASKMDTTKINLYNKIINTYRLKDSLEAKKYFNDALTLARKSNFTEGIADSYAGFGSFYLSNNIAETAIMFNKKSIEVYGKALKIADNDDVRTRINSKMAHCYHETGIAYSNVSDYANAKYYYLNSLHKFIETNDMKGMSTCYNNLAVTSKSLGDYAEAIDYNQKSYELFCQLNDSVAMAGSFSIVASIYEKLGDYSKALDYYYKSLKITEKIKHFKGMSKCYNSIGNILYEQKNYNRAIDYFNKSLEIKEKTDDQLGKANSLNNIGLVYMNTKENSKAIEHYEMALKIFKEYKYQQGEAICYNNLAMVYKSRGDYVKAIENIKSSLKIFESIGDKPNTGMSYINLADLYNLTGNYSEALQNSTIGFAIADEIKYLELKKSAYYSTYETYQKLNNIPQSLKFLKLYSQAKDSLFNIEKNKQMLDMEAKYQLKEKQQQIENLEKDKKLQNVELESQTAQKLTYLLGFLLMIIAVLGVLKRYFDKKKANTTLTIQKNKISEKNQELQAQHEEITSQKSLLEENLKYIENLQEALKHDLSKYKQIALVKLMNPHFIFNSFNSIQSFILQNDKLQASIYLSKFSDLMRKVLDYSQKEYITLEEELNALALYIELEQKRCNDKFTFEINIDPDIEKDIFRIPPLIIQPFVENSIWHGLVHKEKQGHLIINVFLENKFVICSIEDNGIGREKSNEINKRKYKHKSYGLDITNQRLKIFNSLTKTETIVNYFDLKDERGDSLGTKVVFEIPIIFDDLE